MIDKAIVVANDKGMKIDEHFNQSVDMVRVGGRAFRKVETLHLSRLACLIIAENADEKKPMVQQARLFFSNTVSTGELIRNSVNSNILFYKTTQGETRIEVIFNGDTFWMSQKRMADLFGVDVRTVNYHLKQIFDSGELSEEATIRKIGIVQSEGDSAWSIFLSMNYYKAIVSTGTVSQEEARDKAYSEYDKFNNNACNAASEP